MLKAIEIENFKAFGERQRLEFKPLTLLFGPNSSGKSSVLHALHFLRAVCCDRSGNFRVPWSGGGAVDLGPGISMVRGRKIGAAMSFRLEFDMDGVELPDYAAGLGAFFDFDAHGYYLESIRSRVRSAAVDLNFEALETPTLREIRIEINSERFASLRMPRESPQSEIVDINWTHSAVIESERDVADRLKEKSFDDEVQDEQSVLDLIDQATAICEESRSEWEAWSVACRAWIDDMSPRLDGLERLREQWNKLERDSSTPLLDRWNLWISHINDRKGELSPEILSKWSEISQKARSETELRNELRSQMDRSGSKSKAMEELIVRIGSFEIGNELLRETWADLANQSRFIRVRMEELKAGVSGDMADPDRLRQLIRSARGTKAANIDMERISRLWETVPTRVRKPDIRTKLSDLGYRPGGGYGKAIELIAILQNHWIQQGVRDDPRVDSIVDQVEALRKKLLSQTGFKSAGLAQIYEDLTYSSVEGAVIQVEKLDPVFPDYTRRLVTSADEGSKLEALKLETVLSTLILGPLSVMASRLRDYRYVGPLRLIPERNAESAPDFALSGWATGAEAWRRLNEAAERGHDVNADALIEEVSRWLSDDEKLGTGYVIERQRTVDLPFHLQRWLMSEEAADQMEQIQGEISKLKFRCNVAIRDVAANMIVHPKDIGIGISQVIPVIVALSSPGSNLVAVEQPELHLHPKQQAALADAFVEAAMKSDNTSDATMPSNRRLTIVETHSGSFTHRLMRRIRENTNAGDGLARGKVRVAYIMPASEGSRILLMRVGDQGEILDPWPDDFFQQDSLERFSE